LRGASGVPVEVFVEVVDAIPDVVVVVVRVGRHGRVGRDVDAAREGKRRAERTRAKNRKAVLERVVMMVTVSVRVRSLSLSLDSRLQPALPACCSHHSTIQRMLMDGWFRPFLQALHCRTIPHYAVAMQ
jgi:hypothetical protein